MCVIIYLKKDEVIVVQFVVVDNYLQTIDRNVDDKVHKKHRHKIDLEFLTLWDLKEDSLEKKTIEKFKDFSRRTYVENDNHTMMDHWMMNELDIIVGIVQQIEDLQEMMHLSMVIDHMDSV